MSNLELSVSTNEYPQQLSEAAYLRQSSDSGAGGIHVLHSRAGSLIKRR